MRPFLILGVSIFYYSHIYYSLIPLSRFDRDWKKIEAFVGSKTVIQVISISWKILHQKCINITVLNISCFKSTPFILLCNLYVLTHLIFLTNFLLLVLGSQINRPMKRNRGWVFTDNIEGLSVLSMLIDVFPALK